MPSTDRYWRAGERFVRALAALGVLGGLAAVAVYIVVLGIPIERLFQELPTRLDCNTLNCAWLYGFMLLLLRSQVRRANERTLLREQALHGNPDAIRLARQVAIPAELPDGSREPLALSWRIPYIGCLGSLWRAAGLLAYLAALFGAAVELP